MDTIYSPKFARGFAIQTNANDTIITIYNPFQGDAQTTNHILLDRPMRRIVCMSSSHIAFLETLGEHSRVVGASGVRFITSERIDKEQIVDVGYDANLDYERIAALRPDIVLLYGITGENSTACAKFDELGIRYAYIGEHVERTPLAKSEWLVAFGYLCGMGQRAQQEFDLIASRYDSLRQIASALTSRPRVMLNAPYRDVWYVPSDDSYMVALLADAGADYVCRGDSSHTSRPIDTERAYAYMQRADIWLNTNQYQTLGELCAANPRFADTPPVLNGKVYNNTLRTSPAGGSDFWESGCVRADRVLADIIEIIHPEATEHTLYYYKQLK